MVFDLGAALRKKGEFESARLLDFVFRRRARATRLLADRLGLDPDTIVGSIARLDEEGVLDTLAAQTGVDRSALAADYAACLAQAHAALIADRGDPTPHRLA